MADLIDFFGKGLFDRNAKFEKLRIYGFSRLLESLNSNLNPEIKNFPIKNGRFNMADQNFEILSIYVKLNFLSCLRSFNPKLLRKPSETDFHVDRIILNGNIANQLHFFKLCPP